MSDAEYFAKREIEERDWAAKATDDKSREVHLKLAARYKLLSQIEASFDNVEPKS